MSYYYSVVEHDFAKAQAEARPAHARNNLDYSTSLPMPRNTSGNGILQSRTSRRPYNSIRGRRPIGDLGFALVNLRLYAGAKIALDRALALTPGDLTAVEWRVMASLGEGDSAGAQRVLHAVPATVDQASLVSSIADERGQEWMLDDVQRRLLLTLRPSDFDDDRPTWALTLAQGYATLGDTSRCRAYADSAVAAYKAVIPRTPGRGERYSELGVAYAYAGRSRGCGEHG